MVVYAESTPNPAAMKFVANRVLLENATPLEYMSPAEAKSSPLAAELFKFPFIKSVFIAGNYVTVFKDEKLDWDDITLELREFFREYLASGKVVIGGPTQTLPSREGLSSLSRVQVSPEGTDEGRERSSLEGASVDHAVPQNEIEQKIIATLEQYITPAVAQDGGMIVFRSYKDGVVSLLMRGACSGCPSSTVTLKAGIQAILKKFVPEVIEVISEG